MKILQIIPRLPPAVCGVGDYAHELAREWKRQGIGACFMGGDPAWHGIDAEFPSETVTARTSTALCASLTRLHAREGFDAVVLQFSGYGFAPRGAPIWLLRGLQSWLGRNPNLPLLTMFHELFASGPVTSSAFWLGALQKRVCARLARLSRFVRTNRTASAAWLENASPEHAGSILVQPVFSNLGENFDAPPPSRRPKNLALFGYQAGGALDFWKPLPRVLNLLDVAKVIGLGTVKSHHASVSVPVEERGFLKTQEMSALLQGARLGYLHYNTEFLGKSGILAAYAAHGVVPVLAPYAGNLSESLEHGVNVLRVDFLREPVDEAALDELSGNILRWYAPHSIGSTASGYQDQLRKVA